MADAHTEPYLGTLTQPIPLLEEYLAIRKLDTGAVNGSKVTERLPGQFLDSGAGGTEK